jgi:isopropylmalate/isohomocitrate dehydrogenase-like protein
MLKLLIAAGDGIGPEVVEPALWIMDALGLDFELFMEPVGKAGIQERGEAITDETIELAREVDAILFGAVETPTAGEAYRSPLLTLRRELDLFANVRPARPLVPWLGVLGPPRSGGPPPSVDMVIVRENTEGLYVGREREVEGGAIAERLVTTKASRRVCEFAFEWAAARERSRVTCVHKANVLRLTDGLFLEAFRDVAAAKAGRLVYDDLHVDSAAARMVQNPTSLDVVVAPNLYGDILSDLAAGLVGGLGFAPSANIGEAHALFEPVHGSAPDIAGKGIANPSAAILSAAMMLEHLGHGADAMAMERALRGTLEAGIATPDAGGEYTTMGFAEEVRRRLEGKTE